MLSFRIFKYASPFLIYLGALTSFVSSGWVIWLPLLYTWILVPVLELFIRGDESNLSVAEEDLAKKNRSYDLLIYLVVPFQFCALYIFLQHLSVEQPWWDLAGKTAVMGLLCGVFGINVGHELGHRIKRWEQHLAKALLLTSMYMHFYIEHNRGHHKRVATPEDPSSARLGEMVYQFYYRSIVFSYLSAWHIAIGEMRKKGYPVISWHNEMIQAHVIQMAFVLLVYFIFGLLPMLLFLLAALQGILLLETVNYIEHYGLQRKALGDGKYERALPVHSWNSNHIIGRVMLFELSRHSDHHYMASRKYQVLRHHDHSPQMPTGYPGMMLLALVPPAWFFVMNKKVQQIQLPVEHNSL